MLGSLQQISASDIGVVDSTQQAEVGTLAVGTCYISSAGTSYVAPSTAGATKYAGNTYIYLKGIGSTVAGSAVTYDEAGITTLLAANAIGPVAFATAATVANTWGWYLIAGTGLADIVANSADNATIGRETSDGKVGDGRAAGDEIIGAVQRVAVTTAQVGLIQCQYPLVNDKTGS